MCLSVRLHGVTWLPLEGFSWNLWFEIFFSKICRENSSFIEIQQQWRVIYMKTFSYLRTISRWIFPTVRNVSNKRCRENQNINFMFRNFSRKCAVYEMMSKNMVEPDRQQTIWRMRVACWISKDTRVQAHARAHAPTHTPAHVNARARTHTHTHTQRNMWFLLFFHATVV